MTLGHPRLVAVTLAAGAASCALLVAGPPLAWIALAVPFLYLGLLVEGVMRPGLAMFAPVVCRGPSSRPEVALTFDDGPNPVSTRQVLAVLARRGVRATFFVLGAKAAQAPDVLREIVAAGHELGLHGYTHDRRLSFRHPDAITASLTRTLAEVESATGRRPTLFRPPMGHVSPRTAVAARRLGLVLVGWSVRSRDGRASTSAEQASRRVIASLRAGAVILMHDAAERDDRQPVAPFALPAILDGIERRGLSCVTLSRLLRPPDRTP